MSNDNNKDLPKQSIKQVAKYNLLAHIPCCGTAISLAFFMNGLGAFGIYMEAFHELLHTTIGYIIFILGVPLFASLMMGYQSYRHHHGAEALSHNCQDHHNCSIEKSTHNRQKNINKTDMTSFHHLKRHLLSQSTGVAFVLGVILQCLVLYIETSIH